MLQVKWGTIALVAACGSDGSSAGVDASSGDGGSVTASITSSSGSGSTTDATGGESSTGAVDLPDVGPPNHQPDVAWVYTFGGPWDQMALRIASLPDGGVVFYASVDAEVDLGAGTVDPTYDSVLGVLDAQGQYAWSLELESSAAVAVSPSGNIVVGTKGSDDAHVIMLDAEGTELWRRLCGPDSVWIEDVAVAADGSIAVIGWFSSTLDLGTGVHNNAGEADAWVARLDADGVPIWVDAISGPGGEYGNAIVHDPAGGLLVAGHFLTTIDLGGDELTGKDGNFVAKLDVDGQHQWSEAIQWASWEVRDFAVDGSGASVIMTGGVLAPGGLAKFDADGALLWSTNAALDNPLALATTAEGTIFVGGIAQFGWTVQRLDGDAEQEWQWHVLGEGPDHDSDGAAAMTLDAEGNLLIAGYYSGTADFGTGEHVPLGKRDGVIVKVLDP